VFSDAFNAAVLMLSCDFELLLSGVPFNTMWLSCSAPRPHATLFRSSQSNYYWAQSIRCCLSNLQLRVHKSRMYVVFLQGQKTTDG